MGMGSLYSLTHKIMLTKGFINEDILQSTPYDLALLQKNSKEFSQNQYKDISQLKEPLVAEEYIAHIAESVRPFDPMAIL